MSGLGCRNEWELNGCQLKVSVKIGRCNMCMYVCARMGARFNQWNRVIQGASARPAEFHYIRFWKTKPRQKMLQIYGGNAGAKILNSRNSKFSLNVSESMNGCLFLLCPNVSLWRSCPVCSQYFAQWPLEKGTSTPGKTKMDETLGLFVKQEDFLLIWGHLISLGPSFPLLFKSMLCQIICIPLPSLLDL